MPWTVASTSVSANMAACGVDEPEEICDMLSDEW